MPKRKCGVYKENVEIYLKIVVLWVTDNYK